MIIYRLNDIEDKDIENVGGKAKGLYLLIKCGLSVPAGFVAIGPKDDIDMQLASDYYEKSGLGQVAVRSSAAAEDGADFSNAGQYDTFLNIKGKNAVKKAVKDCVDSLYNRTAKGYSDYFGASKSYSMCVIVQQMIDSDISGVCFTKDPGGKGMLIEAIEGLGDILVGGKTKAYEYRIGEGAMPKGGSVLSEDIIGQIVSDARAARDKLGYELDMEWAIKDGKLFWLQARPITVNGSTDAFELDTKGITQESVLTTCNVG